MARNFHRKDRLSALTEINVTPLIDLAFALLIIFMITTPLLEQTIELDLPIETNKDQSQDRDDFLHLNSLMEAENFRSFEKLEKSQTRAPPTTTRRSLRTRHKSSLVCCIHHTRNKSTN